jgi:hypothetical protein
VIGRKKRGVRKANVTGMNLKIRVEILSKLLRI